VIAVYSDADRGAKHVREADEAYHLGPSPASQSYLDRERIIELARRVRAQAVHPGYGFLSENADFAQGCIDADMIFVGPPPQAIRAMGSKSASKASMAAAGVPVAPGYHGSDQSPGHLAAEAQRVGFPLIIKASAGGGGKGMQVVRAAAEVPAAVESAQRLARTAFGDDRLLFERYFPDARHVEVQIFADAHGETVALFDRDCSVQRRHQKIIEEAPAPGLRAEVRASMAQAAVTAARAVGYVGAGTVEFIAEGDEFYFMEMNTRLQVEHPVTEMVTGIDLVKAQLRIASGEKLADILPGPLSSPQPIRGHAIECRINAEHPEKFTPSAGKITAFNVPGGNGVRVDTAQYQEGVVPPYYDSLIAKLIVHGKDRTEALARMSRALEQFVVEGIHTTIPLHRKIFADAEFRRGEFDTKFMERFFEREKERLAEG
jgi:acetyl-CoA carboxylase biotin carboxylase subunit